LRHLDVGLRRAQRRLALARLRDGLFEAEAFLRVKEARCKGVRRRKVRLCSRLARSRHDADADSDEESTHCTVP
jgi:hypothetical protein